MMVIKEAIEIVNSLGGKDKAKRDREYDEGLFEALNEDISSDEVSELGDSLCDDAEYYSSQFQPLLDAVEFIEDDDNEFKNREIESEACDLKDDINKLWFFVQEIVEPHHNQDDDDDTRYTFNYKRWDREIEDCEAASKEFQENMEEVISMCNAVKASYKSFRDQVREDLAM